MKVPRCSSTRESITLSLLIYQVPSLYFSPLFLLPFAALVPLSLVFFNSKFQDGHQMLWSYLWEEQSYRTQSGRPSETQPTVQVCKNNKQKNIKQRKYLKIIAISLLYTHLLLFSSFFASIFRQPINERTSVPLWQWRDRSDLPRRQVERSRTRRIAECHLHLVAHDCMYSFSLFLYLVFFSFIF